MIPKFLDSEWAAISPLLMTVVVIAAAVAVAFW
jgi:hypothetical protein